MMYVLGHWLTKIQTACQAYWQMEMTLTIAGLRAALLSIEVTRMAYPSLTH